MRRTIVTCLTLMWLAPAQPVAGAGTEETGEREYTVHLKADGASLTMPTAPTFTARFTQEDIQALLTDAADLLPLPLRGEAQRRACSEALRRVSMQAVVEKLQPSFAERFAERFDASKDVIVAPIPGDRQVDVEAPFLPAGSYRGPTDEIIGFMLHDIDEATFANVSILVIQTARQLLDTGDPAVDRAAENYYQLAAGRELAKLRAAYDAQSAETRAKEEIRGRIGRELGIVDSDGGVDEARARWVKESRRFSYVVKTGKFIDKLQPLVDDINREITMAGFRPGAEFITDAPGIQFDPDLGDVEILLPRSLLNTFLAEADLLERRMAEDAMITIEAVRLTDRDILSNAVASQLRAQVQGVHDVTRFNPRSVLRQAGINALTAIANRELQIADLRLVTAGEIPAGVSPVQIPDLTLPALKTERLATTVGSTFSIGADEIFFDGREQSYGFSYIGPDGIEHTLAYDVVDSLRDFWERIERNLIVHKIKKTDALEKFTVPVGPETKTFEGIAALISQQNQKIVVATGTGALSELSATAGTWLVIKDFEITPIPGSSTALTDVERTEIEDRVLLTMLLRDPLVDCGIKTRLVELDEREELSRYLEALKYEYANRPLRGGRDDLTFGALLQRRLAEAIEDATVEKKEHNSKITLTFYSSQGTILAQSGATALGDANDLTSFTTELSPNKVTPISSFFTKTSDGTEDTSPLTDLARGETERKEKTMTHLVIRARFPTVARETADRDEGRYLGYFDLPMGRQPLSTVNLPFLSSSEHPLDRLAQVRMGRMFPALDAGRIRDPFLLFNPNRLVGDVPRKVWEACTTRMLMNRRMISDSPSANQVLASEYSRRFIAEVRSLLEYDPDLFDAPNAALRNMLHWNDTQRVVLALNTGGERFALGRLIVLIDELGGTILPQTFIDDNLAVSARDFWGHHRLQPLSEEEIRSLRRDVALHFLRMNEAFGDAFLEAASIFLGLNTYQSLKYDAVTAGPFRGYTDFVFFDASAAAYADPTITQAAHDDFLLLRSGGYKGTLFEPSLEFIEQLSPNHRAYVVRGREVLGHRQSP